MSIVFIDILLYKYHCQLNKEITMAKKKLKTPEDIIEAIREKQSEIDDLIYDLEDKVSDISSVEDEDEDIDETDEE
jgi:predicted  nucleic acid-binding Zn-ribbon protein